jgi:glycosyltransferase involved in cell wall biosynthesis
VWVFSAPIAERLDNATWVDTTNELRALGWKVTLIGMGPAGPHYVRGVETYCIPRPDIYLLGHALFHRDVARHLLEQWDQIDVVLFNQDSAAYLLPLRFWRTLSGRDGPQFVMDTRDRRDFKTGSLKAMLRLAFIRLNHWLAKILADGQTTITSRYAALIAIPEKQLWGIWPSGVYPQQFAAAAAKRIWPAEDKPIRLVYIGMLVDKRHPIELCRAVEMANAQGCSFELYFYGNGPDVDSVRQCADSSEAVVKLLPPIGHEDVPEMLATMHIGVTSLPEIDDQKYAASSPIKLFEYMASGLPILATANPCHTNVVGDGSYAFWIEETTQSGILKGLEQIWDNRDSLASLGWEAQEASQRWTWAAAAAKLDLALKSGLARKTLSS